MLPSKTNFFFSSALCLIFSSLLPTCTISIFIYDHCPEHVFIDFEVTLKLSLFVIYPFVQSKNLKHLPTSLTISQVIRLGKPYYSNHLVLAFLSLLFFYNFLLQLRLFWETTFYRIIRKVYLHFYRTKYNKINTLFDYYFVIYPCFICI